MDEPLWMPEQSKFVKKTLKRYKSDPRVTKRFDEIVKRLIHEEDPAAIAYEITKDNVCIQRVLKNVRLTYWMNYDTKVLYLGQLGSHKQVYGSD